METQLQIATPGLRGLERPDTESATAFPALEARRGGPADRLGRSLEKHGAHPVLVFVAGVLVATALVAALSIGLGLLVTGLFENAPGNARAAVWLAAHRTPNRTDASLIGSIAAGGVVLPIIAGVVALVSVAARRWRIAAFAVFALAVESASYRLTTLVVHSDRPGVVRLEHLPVNASYPSGHVAATIAVYGGLALLLTSRFTSPLFRFFAWAAVVGMVAFVAGSRMYRGMHHPLDVVGGIVIGIAAVIMVVFVCRTAGAAAEARQRARPLP
jgi:membrane-associated phospholipid phosphatase